MQYRRYEAACPLKSQCLRNATQKSPRQVNVKLGTTEKRK